MWAKSWNITDEIQPNLTWPDGPLCISYIFLRQNLVMKTLNSASYKSLSDWPGDREEDVQWVPVGQSDAGKRGAPRRTEIHWKRYDGVFSLFENLENYLLDEQTGRKCGCCDHLREGKRVQWFGIRSNDVPPDSQTVGRARAHLPNVVVGGIPPIVITPGINFNLWRHLFAIMHQQFKS